MPQNHWGVFKDSVARWDLEFPAQMWARWTEFLAFSDGVFELGRREAVFIVDEVPPATLRARSVFGEVVPAARVSMFGSSGIEDRIVRDLRHELLTSRPDLDADSVPHGSALSISGPLFLDRDGPVEVAISIDTDIWFPRVIDIHGISGDIVNEWYDNTALATRHTPRLNRFLSTVRERAAALGARWSYEATHNKNYAGMVSESGIAL